MQRDTIWSKAMSKTSHDPKPMTGAAMIVRRRIMA